MFRSVRGVFFEKDAKYRGALKEFEFGIFIVSDRSRILFCTFRWSLGIIILQYQDHSEFAKCKYRISSLHSLLEISQFHSVEAIKLSP